METSYRPINILVAEDDDDDYLLALRALKEAQLLNEVRRVCDGEELMRYLRHDGEYDGDGASPRPTIILLDLNMPRKDGREVLVEIRADPDLRRIPVVVLTTSKSEEDVLRSYDLGVNSFIRKPLTLEQLIEVIRVFKHYWLEIVELPE